MLKKPNLRAKLDVFSDFDLVFETHPGNVIISLLKTLNAKTSIFAPYFSVLRHETGSQ